MQKFYPLLLLPLLIFPKIPNAQNPSLDWPDATEQIHVNNLWLPKLQPAARLGNVANLEGAVFANYNGNPQPTAGIYTSSLWIGGIDAAGKIRVAAETFHNEKNHFRYAPGPQGTADCKPWDRFWAISRAALERHRADLADGKIDLPLEPEIEAWPATGNPNFKKLHGYDLPPDGSTLAPFFDADGDGKYDPTAGDFPHPAGADTSLHPSKIVWSLFHDPKIAYADSLGSLGFEFGWTAWAMACADTSVLNDAVFFSLKIRNASSQVVDSVQVGIWNDHRLGKKNDEDGFGTDLPTSSFFYFNTTPNDIPALADDDFLSYHKNPPAAAFTLLGRPLKHSIFSMGGATCELPAYSSPSNAKQFYHRLNGRLITGEQITFKSWVSDSTFVSDFVFADRPSVPNGWNMLNYRLSCDFQRTLWTAALDKMQPNQTETLEYAYTFHRDSVRSNLENVDFMFARLGQLHQFYDQNFKNACAPPLLCQPDDHSDCVWAGDANHDGTVNHRDLLPIALKMGKTGSRRQGFTVWQGQQSSDWGENFDQKFDLKHADCNGDARLDSSDLNVVRDFFGFRKPAFLPPADEFSSGTEIFLQVYGSAKPENVKAGQLASLFPTLANLPDIRAVAFEIEFDTNYWRLYPPATPPAVSLKHDSTQISMFGKKADGSFEAQVRAKPSVFFNFKNLILLAKNISPDLPKLTFVKLKNLEAYRFDGSKIEIGSWARQFCFGGGCAVPTADFDIFEEVKIFPNPADEQITVLAGGRAIEQIRLFDATGRLLRLDVFSEKLEQQRLDFSGLPDGFYFLKIGAGGREFLKKVVVQK